MPLTCKSPCLTNVCLPIRTSVGLVGDCTLLARELTCLPGECAPLTCFIGESLRNSFITTSCERQFSVLADLVRALRLVNRVYLVGVLGNDFAFDFSARFTVSSIFIDMLTIRPVAARSEGWPRYGECFGDISESCRLVVGLRSLEEGFDGWSALVSLESLCVI